MHPTRRLHGVSNAVKRRQIAPSKSVQLRASKPEVSAALAAAPGVAETAQPALQSSKMNAVFAC